MGDELLLLNKSVNRGMRRWWLKVGVWWSGSFILLIIAMFAAGLYITHSRDMNLIMALQGKVLRAFIWLFPMTVSVFWWLTANQAVSLACSIMNDTPLMYHRSRFYFRYLFAMKEALIPLIVIWLYKHAVVYLGEVSLLKVPGFNFSDYFIPCLREAIVFMIAFVFTAIVMSVTQDKGISFLTLTVLDIGIGNHFILEIINGTNRRGVIYQISSSFNRQFSNTEELLLQLLGLAIFSVCIILYQKMKGKPGLTVLSVLLAIIMVAPFQPSIAVYFRSPSMFALDRQLEGVYQAANIADIHTLLSSIYLFLDTISNKTFFNSSFSAPQTSGIVYSIVLIIVSACYFFWGALVLRLAGQIKQTTPK